MHNRIARSTVSIAGALIALGALGATSAGAAGAATSTPITNRHLAGYQIGDNNWRFRFNATEFTVPEHACDDDSYLGSGIALTGTTDNVAVGVACDDGTPEAGFAFAYSGTTDPGLFTHGTHVSRDDLIQAQIYYDPANNHVFLWEFDVTRNRILVNDSFNAHSALYKTALQGAWVDNPLDSPPAPDTSFVLVPFADSMVTTYNGTHGTGVNGPWGVTQIQALNGAHIIAAAPVLYNGNTQFNVRLYGNS